MSGKAIDKKLKEYIDNNEINSMINLCEQFEFDIAEGKTNGNPFYVPQMLGYLILNDLNSARFLWKRIGKKYKEDDELKGVWEIGKTMWNRNYTEFYTQISGKNWNESISPLLEMLRDTFRDRTLTLISNAYSDIKVGECAGLLGLAEADTRKLALARGWTETAGNFQPKPFASSSSQFSNADHLLQLTQYVVWLESK